MITRTLKQDDLAAAFSTTSLSELEQNYSSGLVVENNMSLFAENSEVLLFCLSILSADKTSKNIDRYFRKRRSGNRNVYAPKFPPITPVKAFPKFECNVYSDIDVQSAISVTSTGNSRSFTELTDRLAFVNFSSPVLLYYVSVADNEEVLIPGKCCCLYLFLIAWTQHIVSLSK